MATCCLTTGSVTSILHLCALKWHAAARVTSPVLDSHVFEGVEQVRDTANASFELSCDVQSSLGILGLFHSRNGSLLRMAFELGWGCW